MSDRSEEMSLVVKEVEIDWLVPSGTLALTGFWQAGLFFAALAFGIEFAFARRVAIGSEAGLPYFVVARLWERERDARRVIVVDAVLRYWNRSAARGLELRGSNASVVAAARGDRKLRPPVGIQALHVKHPPIVFKVRPISVNVINIALLAGSLVAVRHVPGWIPVVVYLLGVAGIVTSVAAALRGAPVVAIGRAR